ncbi:hypothetical protein [Methylobacterium oxalidis]|uniref:Uncharacterized protein n=1 Tax=Methylobacterium oxalidis TaxID=944322 RepID=A0A512J6P3_9HYPH|nr:hypothetical protein [Methylobacterium oxalidis]GEP05562.1 hypothetical protein MOX02_36000 [Methylobacterium oxalidis]GJE32710.1 hypothetical protein LDDCCGHA_2899 [Methylobacterium oxalidis]GLS65457.1 hypothetical protein GCM10007888_38390 [Methylobacterium oxalidis]
MKLSAIKVDSARLGQGRWIGEIPEMGDLRLRVRGIGNTEYRRLQSKLFDAVPRSKRVHGRIDPDEVDRITAQCLLDTVLLDWEGLTADDGATIPYSRDLAEQYLTDPDFARFRQAVSWAATVAADEVAGNDEVDRGN